MHAAPHRELPDLPFLVDTGANVSMLPYNWYMAIPEAERPALAESPLQILAGNQSQFNVTGVARFDIRIKDMEYPCLMHVSPDETSGVLGMDFMVQHRVVVDPREQRLSINNIPMEVLDYNGQRINSRVTATKTVHLQPKERYVVPGLIAGRRDLEERTVVVEGAHSLVLRHGAMAARVIARARNGIVPMEVRNITDEVQTIHRGTVLGVAFQAVEMKPWVDVDLTTVTVDTPQADAANGTTAPDDLSTGPVDKSSIQATVHRINATPTSDVSAEGLPGHIQELYMKHHKNMVPEDQLLYKELLMKYSSIFATSKTDLGRTKLIKHHIETGDEQPFKHKPRRLPQAKFEEMKKQVEALHAQGVIRPSTSNWGSNVLLVKKKDCTWRMCIDYRELNAKTKNVDPYMLPRVDDTLDALSGAKFFCTLDLISGYHQLELTEESKPKTAFLTPRMNPSQWEYNMLPFGVLGGPATFQRAIDLLLLGLEYKVALAYLDDIIVFGKSHRECIERLAQVFERLVAANLKLKPSKCVMFAPETLFLGHIISADGVKCDPKKVDAVKNWQRPQTPRQVQVFLGTVNYYNRFIKDYSNTAKPLYALASMRKRKHQFDWTPECEEAFNTLRTALISAPVMAYPCAEGLMVLDTDASAFAIGGVLSQMQKITDPDGHTEEVEKVIAYASRTLEGREQRYCTRRRELLAIVAFVKHFRAYLYGRECLIRTDHASLKYIKSLRDPDDQFARWIERLEETYYTIEVRKGVDHANADALSRLPSDTCAGKRCICPGVTALELSGDYQDSHAIQAEIDKAELHSTEPVAAVAAASGDLSTGPVDKIEAQATVHRICARPRSDANSSSLLVLDIDIAAHGLAAVLSQVQRRVRIDGHVEETENVLMYTSHAWTGFERRYCECKRETLAIRAVIHRLKDHLAGHRCVVKVGGCVWKTTDALQDPEEQVAHWLENLHAIDRRVCSDAVAYVRHNTAVLKQGTSSSSTAAESTAPAVLSTGPVDSTTSAPTALEQAGASSNTLATSAKMSQNMDSTDEIAFVEEWDAQSLSSAQQADHEIAPIYRAKQAAERRPTEAAVGGYSEATKAYLHDWDRLFINDNGVLYRRFESHDGTDDWQQVILPQKYRLEACKRFHNSTCAAHMGRRKTLMKMQRRFHWHRMAEDIRWWITTCDICQKRKCPHAWPKAPMQMFLAGEPNERVAMDIIDHLQVSSSGNCCVLTITDHFSKYVKAIPLPNQQAETVADAFVRGWIAVFGAPLMLHTDQGRNFDSAVVAEMCQLLDIYKTRTSAYHPAGNGHTERYNRCVMDMIHAQIRLDPSDWDRALALACLAYNSTPHTSTGFEPNRLMLGRNTYMPADRMMPHNPSRRCKSITEFARELDLAVRHAHQVAREHTHRAATAQKKYYDRTAHLKHYKVGEKVQLKVFRKEKGVGKFADRFEGPYYVLDVISDVNFRIIRAMEDKPRVVHHDHIVPYVEREPEQADDKAWVYKRSRTYRPPPSDAAAQTDGDSAQGTLNSVTSAAAETAAETDPTDVEMTSEPAMMAGAGDDSPKPQENEASSDAAESQSSKEYVAEATYERRIP